LNTAASENNPSPLEFTANALLQPNYETSPIKGIN
jgi:hypothetical protein